MERTTKNQTISRFLLDLHEKGHSDVVCPECGKPLRKEGGDVSFTIICETENCFKATLRGI